MVLMEKMSFFAWSKRNIFFYLILTLLLGVGQYIFNQRSAEQDKEERKKLEILAMKSTLNDVFVNGPNWPDQVKVFNKSLSIEYTFDEQLTDFIKRLLKRYRSDYSSIIVIDNVSGGILCAVGHEKATDEFNVNIPFSSTHPSASLFKIVSSAELLHEGGIDSTRIFDYRGKGTTLYKYQLLDKKTRWTRYISFEDAFAFSNNVVFGKAAINHMTGTGIYKMALDFGFNQELMSEIYLPKSRFGMPEDQYHLAELASGFNRQTMISPIHAAVMSSIIANDGVLKYPFLVSEVFDTQSGEQFWVPERDTKEVLDEKTSAQIKEMMEKAVREGTARGSFRKFSKKLRQKLTVGGKTGSITGGIPFGKRDWFTAFAVPKNSASGGGISVSVMNINVKKWYVRSAFLAKEIIEYYFKKVSPLNKEQVLSQNESDRGNNTKNLTRRLAYRKSND